MVIERSRFIGLARPARSADEAEAEIAGIRLRHADATHHCYAWRAGDGQERQSDDGEPQGTAGLPLLEILRRHGVDYGLLCVVRYYGGRKLGRPGLYRAYLGAGGAALEAASVALLVPGRRYAVQVGHAARVPLLRALSEVDAAVLRQEFGADVLIEFWLPESTPFEDLVRRCDQAARAELLGPEVRAVAPDEGN